MKKIAPWLLAAMLALAGSQATAQRLPVPIENHENVVVQPASGKTLTAEQVKNAIVAASTATARKWSVSEAGPGHLVATYHVRTHTVIADIRYTGSQFSLTYKDSVNMKAGGGKIHPFYNAWSADFVQAIKLELSKA